MIQEDIYRWYFKWESFVRQFVIYKVNVIFKQLSVIIDWIVKYLVSIKEFNGVQGKKKNYIFWCQKWYLVYIYSQIWEFYRD